MEITYVGNQGLIMEMLGMEEFLDVTLVSEEGSVRCDFPPKPRIFFILNDIIFYFNNLILWKIIGD